MELYERSGTTLQSDGEKRGVTDAERKFDFVDEAGDPALFNAAGQTIVDTIGCSRFFIIGKLEVEDPGALSGQLESLREEILADPYFAGVPSLQPHRRKTALLFHAKDDVPEVRYRVFNLLRSAGSALRFRAVVRDKQALANREIAIRQRDPSYRYQPDAVYDELIRSLFSKLDRFADRYEICVAKRGARDRNHAIQAAIGSAELDFQGTFGFARGASEDWTVTISDPRRTVCLQAVDYFLWAVQRLYEARPNPNTEERIREDRFFNMLWTQIGEIHDLDYGPAGGTYFTKQRPLLLAGRFPATRPKAK